MLLPINLKHNLKNKFNEKYVTYIEARCIIVNFLRKIFLMDSNSNNYQNNDRVELILVANDVKLNNDRAELILVPNDVELNNDRVELILVPNDVKLNNDRAELILVPNDVELNNDRVGLILVPNNVELNNDRVELILVSNDENWLRSYILWYFHLGKKL